MDQLYTQRRLEKQEAVTNEERMEIMNSVLPGYFWLDATYKRVGVVCHECGHNVMVAGQKPGEKGLNTVLGCLGCHRRFADRPLSRLCVSGFH